MWKLQQVFSYILYRLTAKRPEKLHSPYLFEILPRIHDEERHFYAFDEIEAVRQELLQDRHEIPVVDLGAGSHTLSDRGHRKVSDIARTSLSPEVQCRMVFRLLLETHPDVILELGTSLGVMTVYLSAYDSGCNVHTIEGNPAISEIAENVASKTGAQNITFHTGAFSEILPGLLPEISPVDFLLIDGDHRGKALLGYFEMIRPFLAADAIVLVDDIRWSRDMYQAWQELWHDNRIPCCLDYFAFGLLFFRKEFREPVREKIRIN